MLKSQPGGRILPPIQSARISTKETFNFKYGKVEVKAKLPKGKWLWPAVWMLSSEVAYGSDFDGETPSSGEVDIIEPRGHPNTINFNTLGVHAGDHHVNQREYGEFTPI